MRKGYIVFIFLFFVSIKNFAQKWEWAFNANYVGNSCCDGVWNTSLKCDKGGNCYALEYGPGVFRFIDQTITLSTEGFKLFKYNNEGKLISYFEIPGYILFAIPDNQGNILVGGEENSKGLLAKYNEQGQIIWKILLGDSCGGGIDHGNFDEDGNIYVVGWLGENCYGGRYGGASQFIAKFTSSGQQLWMDKTKYGGSVNQLYLDLNDNCYIIGKYSGQLILKDNQDSLVFKDSIYSTHAYISKYSTDGHILWAKTFAGDVSFGKFVSEDEVGNIYMTGDFWDNIQIESYLLKSDDKDKVFIAKFNSNGEILLLKQITNPKKWTGVLGINYYKNKLYLIINYGDQFNVDDIIIPNSNTMDGSSCIIQFDDSAKALKAIIPEALKDNSIKMSFDDYDNIYVAGNFRGPIRFGTTSFSNLNNYYESFFAKYNLNTITNAVKSNLISEFISIIPNPTQGRFTLQFTDEMLIRIQNKGKICIYDMLGNRIKTIPISSFPKTKTLQIDLSNNEKGIYFLEVNTGKEKIRGKIVLN